MAYLVASVAGVAFFTMSIVLLGIWPGRVLERQTRAMSPARPMALTPSEERGRQIYSREGCAYCHTQQIRLVDADIARFGAPTLAWETRFDYPHLWGTRRIGPDLAREGGVRSQDWHFAHLFAPRAILPQSVMPAFQTLFDGSPDRPRQDARDLVAYLESLGRARELAGAEGEAHARRACNCPDDWMTMMAFHAPSLNASPARTRRGGASPALSATGDRGRGLELYAENCAGCHGPRGEGDGPGAALGLRPRPTNLAQHEYALARLSHVLWNGVDGTSMPAWRDLSHAERAALARVVRDFRVGGDESAPAQDVLNLGARVYSDNCVQCHGVRGAGDGWAAAQLRIAPTDFRTTRPSLATSIDALRNGIAGTQMAPWTSRLSEEELLAAAAYVRSMFEGDKGATVAERAQ
jgi:cbb3-type cytochrome oxidase cytochrome c subunit/cytochrome c553